MIARDGDNPQIRYMYPIKLSLDAKGDVIVFRFGRSTGFQWYLPDGISPLEMEAEDGQ